MTNNDEVLATVKAIVGKVPFRFDACKVAGWLNDTGKKHGLELGPYGYILYVMDKFGDRSMWGNILSSVKIIEDYGAESARIRDDFPVLLLNAETYFSRLAGSIPDMDMCLGRLSGMTFPYVLYILFAGTGQIGMAERYRTEAEELAKRYPSAFDKLPGVFQQAGKELLKNGSTE